MRFSATEADVQDLKDRLQQEIPELTITEQKTQDGVPTLWVDREHIIRALRVAKEKVGKPYSMLYDLTCIDERDRQYRQGQPASDFTMVYHLLSVDRNASLRFKVPLLGDYPSMPSSVPVFLNADWYEREVFDMFGIKFDGHPHLKRILMPVTWEGHPLRREHPARATDMPDFTLPDDKYQREMDAFTFDPDEWGMERSSEETDYLFLNLGPNHPSTHGIFRIVLQLDGEEVLDAVPEIGFHHRGAEKMGERQSWHTFIPYTDRIDYLGGVMNNFAYVLAVEQLAGIEVPDRAKVMRIMLSEFFRIASHLVWYGTFAQDIGQLSPIFLMFEDRERVFDIVESITGGRMHPSWFRIGGTAMDLPQGWDKMVREFLDFFEPRLREYDKMVMKNLIIKKRALGIGQYDTATALEWGVTGAGLRATGLQWDFRRNMPYGGYDQFDFDIPIATTGCSFGRAVVRVEELRQSARIIRQCLDNMPSGHYKSDHPATTPPRKEKTMQDIDTLIPHFLSVTWGPVIPPGEAVFPMEATKGANSYYLVSDGSTSSYRTRIRTPSFPHLQMIPAISRGLLIADIITIIASIDFVMADVDR